MPTLAIEPSNALFKLVFTFPITKDSLASDETEPEVSIVALKEVILPFIYIVGLYDEPAPLVS